MYAVLVLELVILTIEANHQYSYSKILKANIRYSKVEYSTSSLIILYTNPAAHVQSLKEGYSSIAFIARDRSDIAVDPEQLKRERKKGIIPSFQSM